MGNADFVGIIGEGFATCPFKEFAKSVALKMYQSMGFLEATASKE